MKKKTYFLSFFVITLIIFESTSVSAKRVAKRSVEDNQDDANETAEETKEISLDITQSENNVVACARRQHSDMHEIKNATDKQFTFMVAIMSKQNDYLCAGSIVSNGLILTTAQCIDQPVGYILLNTTKAKKSEHSISAHIIKSEKFPTFTGSDSIKDVGLIYTEKFNNSVATKIALSNYTSSRKVVDFESLGFGLNAEVGQTKDLQYIGLERRYIMESEDVINGFFDCIDTNVSTCFRDTGGPIIVDNELIGVVTKGDQECAKEMFSTYAINKHMVTTLPTYTFKTWLDTKIAKNEEHNETDLFFYPSKLNPIRRRMTLAFRRHHYSGAGSKLINNSSFTYGLICIMLTFILSIA